jgi:hypothetical protein
VLVAGFGSIRHHHEPVVVHPGHAFDVAVDDITTAVAWKVVDNAIVLHFSGVGR